MSQEKITSDTEKLNGTGGIYFRAREFIYSAANKKDMCAQTDGRRQIVTSKQKDYTSIERRDVALYKEIPL
jgi:hypothetical protein